VILLPEREEDQRTNQQLTTHLPQTDWDSVAAQAGYKDAKNAKIMFGRFRDKLIKGVGGGAGAGGDDASSSSATAPSGGVDKSSPTKKAGARPKKATEGSPKKGGKGIKKEPLDEDEEMGESEAETIKAESVN